MEQTTLKRTLHSAVRSVDQEKRTVVAVVNTTEVDRYGSIILPGAVLKHIDRYMANPVLLSNHRMSEAPVGRCLDYRATAAEVEMTFEFAPTPEGDKLLALYAGGFMRGFSVGGAIDAAVFAWSDKERKAELPDFARKALEDGQADYVITAMELYEVSCATVPANPGALARAVREGVVTAEFALECLRTQRTPEPAKPEPKEEEEAQASTGEADAPAEVQASAATAEVAASPDLVACSACENDLTAQAKFCAQCGVAVGEVEASVPEPEVNVDEFTRALCEVLAERIDRL